MVLLEEVVCTGVIAYRHLLAWGRKFIESGYELQNTEKTCRQMQDMQGETAAIFVEIQGIPLETHLSRTYRETMTHKENKVETAPKKKHKTSRLSLRVAAADKAGFSQYCKNYRLRQADAFTRLLNKVEVEPGEDIQRLSELLQQAEEKCTVLNEKNKQLQKQLLFSLPSQPERNARNTLMLIKQAVGQYLQLVTPKAVPTGELLRPIPYDRLRRENPDLWMYEYPNEEGSHLVELQALAWGKGRAPVQFIFAETESGALIKFRYYAKKEFVGSPIKDSPFAQYGTRWLLTGKWALDGAMDLAAAFPLSAVVPDKKHTNSLDELIAAAKSR